jgi:peptide/nickel transport system ATP-binding protein
VITRTDPRTEPASTVLDVVNLSVSYVGRQGPLPAVRNATFSVGRDEVFGLVGESGSGKSTLCMAILRLLGAQAYCKADRLALGDIDLLATKAGALRQLRWTRFSYIPQGSMSVMNPVMRIREHFLETIREHCKEPIRSQIEGRLESVLAGVNLRPAVLEQFPHELSGGMKQRVCIALSILLEPELIIADEPTSALDVVSQRVVLETLSAARRRLGASMIMIGHDMALQAQLADRIGIMYAGRFVEIAPTRRIFENPVHPYTQRLIAAIPSIRKRQNVRELALRGLHGADLSTEGSIPEVALREVAPEHLAAVGP